MSKGKTKRNWNADSGVNQKYISEFFTPLSDRENALMAWEHTIMDPWTPKPSRVPVLVGNSLMETEMYQVEMEGTCQANTGGFAFVSVGADSWARNRFSYFHYTTNGYPIWYSDNTYAATVLPGSGATTATTGLKREQLPDLGTNSAVGQHYRLVSIGLTIFPDSPADTTSGRVLICRTQDPIDHPLISKDFAGIVGYDGDSIPFSERALPNWPSGKELHMVGLPLYQDALKFHSNVTVAEADFEAPMLAAVVTGAAAQQSLTWRVVFNYEVEKRNTHQVTEKAAAMFMFGSDAAVAALHNSGLVNGAQAHALQNIYSQTDKALMKNLQAQNPGLAMALQAAAKSRPPNGGAALVRRNKNPNAVVQHRSDGIAGAAHMIAREGGGSGILSWLGGLVGKAGSWLKNNWPKLLETAAEVIPAFL